MDDELGIYEEYPELGICVFTDKNGDALEEKCNFINGKGCLSLDNVEELAHWAIKHGNDKGYAVLELVMKTRMEHNIKKN